jgi:hypothetical protein
MLRIQQVRPLVGFRLELTLTDGSVVERDLTAWPLASMELYDPSRLRLDIRRSFGTKTEIQLDGAEPWTPARIRLKPRPGRSGGYALQGAKARGDRLR